MEELTEEEVAALFERASRTVQRVNENNEIEWVEEPIDGNV